MNKITLKDRTFKVSIPELEILRQVRRVGTEINQDFASEKPLFLVVLNGAFVFAADLLREINMACEIRFIRFSSYSGTERSHEVKQILGLDVDIKDRLIVVVEDIVDSGYTMKQLLETLAKQQPKQIHIASLFVKSDNLKVNLDIKYYCFKIPNDFIVGYGLDYDDLGRNFRDIYTVID
ncbi:MAG: hypoxanthine phosphoribosyltransferase [Bacteroidaceae bacterium]